jgi:hypothetical protein
MLGFPKAGGWVMSNPEVNRAIEHFYRYACTESSVGRLLVLMTDDGVVDIIRGDSRSELLSAALARHAGAGLIPDRGVHAHWVASIVKRIELPGSEYGAPLDRGTGYERRAAG